MSLANEFRVGVATRQVAFNQDLRGIVPASDVDSRYLVHFLRSAWPQIQSRIDAAAHGTKRLPSDKLGTLPVPLPPLPEQKRIAAILDKADAVRRKRQQAIDLTESLLRSVFLEMFGDPVTNPKGFSLVSLGELGDWQSGGTPPRSRPEYFEGDIPWFSSGELNQMYASAANEHISSAALDDTAAKRVPAGALMLGMYDTAALKTSIAAMDCSCNQAVAFAAISSKLAETLFIYSAINIGRDHFRRLQRGVRQKNLNLSLVKSIRLPLPRRSSQNAFRDVALHLHASLLRLERATKVSRELVRTLNQDAFSGNLQ